MIQWSSDISQSLSLVARTFCAELCATRPKPLLLVVTTSFFRSRVESRSCYTILPQACHTVILTSSKWTQESMSVQQKDPNVKPSPLNERTGHCRAWLEKWERESERGERGCDATQESSDSTLHVDSIHFLFSSWDNALCKTPESEKSIWVAEVEQSKQLF